MAGSTVDYSSALEDCLIAIGLGEDLDACLARHPEHAEQLRPYLEMIIKMRQTSGSDRQSLADIPADVSFNVALNHSIQMIMRGKTPVYCYTQYPEYAAQLKPWLLAVVDIRKHGGIGTVKEIEFPTELLTPQVSFKEALEYCLAALARGIQPEVALTLYPYYADRLRIWVYYVATLRTHLDLGFRARPVERPHPLSSLAQVRSFSYSLSSFAISLILAISLLLGSMGLVNASWGAKPNESLYFIKDAMQKIQIELFPILNRADAAVYIVRDRRLDVSYLVKNGVENVDVDFAGHVIAVNPNSIEIEDVGTVYFVTGDKFSALEAGMYVHITGRTGVNGIKANGVDVVNPPGSTPAPVVVTLPTATRTLLPTMTATRWLSPTPTLIPPTWTNSPTPVPSATFTASPTNTAIPTNTATLTSTATATELPTETPEPTLTFTPEPTLTFTPEPTLTFTPEPTLTFTPEPTLTFTPEPTLTFTPEPTDTPTPRPTSTPTEESMPTLTPTIDPTFIP